MPSETIPFTMSELWAGSEGMKCEHSSDCDSHGSTVFLSPADVERLNTSLPAHVEEGLARGPEAANMIFQEKLGTVLCEGHHGEGPGKIE